MRTGTITLIMAMAAGTAMSAACDRQEQRNMAPTAPDLSRTAPNPNVDPSVPKVALGTPTAEERKESSQPVQGEVDTKEAPQRKDFEQKK
jgi:hypothetical protein